jgi:hypothetical protein
MAGYAHYNGLASDDDDDDANDFFVQYLRTFLQTLTLLGNAVRSVLMIATRRRAGTVDAGDDLTAPRPGRGVAASGAKAEYVRVGGAVKYHAVRNSHDPFVFGVCLFDKGENYIYVGEGNRAQGGGGSSRCELFFFLSCPPVHEAGRSALKNFCASDAGSAFSPSRPEAWRSQFVIESRV